MKASNLKERHCFPFKLFIQRMTRNFATLNFLKCKNKLNNNVELFWFKELSFKRFCQQFPMYWSVLCLYRDQVIPQSFDCCQASKALGFPPVSIRGFLIVGLKIEAVVTQSHSLVTKFVTQGLNGCHTSFRTQLPRVWFPAFPKNIQRKICWFCWG